MTSTHRLLATIFVWIAFAWSITLIYGMALTLWLSGTMLLAVTLFLVIAAVAATLLITRSDEQQPE